METNWAGNHVYRAAGFAEPTSIAELQELVATHERVRALGSRHSFSDLTDTAGVLVSLTGMPDEIELDESRRSVTVAGGVRYGQLAEALHARGWALANMASLPHISVAGAVATGTHGSGDRNTNLSAAVSAVEAVGPDGELYRIARGVTDFDGAVVALGALGIVTSLTMDIEPTFEVRQDVYTDLPWRAVEESFDAITSSAYSVSLFTDWTGDDVSQVWLKSRGDDPAGTFFGAVPAVGAVHMLAGASVESVTDQGGVAGPWHQRLPHFRMAFTPSRGEELQSEYFVRCEVAQPAFAALRAMSDLLAPVLQVSEIRTIARDTLWLSGAYGDDAVGLHFTWIRDTDAVNAVLAAVESALLPLGARPHWGKCFVASRADIAHMYPRLDDFRQLRRRTDPAGTFGNAFLERTIGM